jgi:outer membrane biosynthesis protein TonB
MRKRGFYIFIIISLALHTALFAVLAQAGLSSKGKAVPVVYEVDIVPGPPGTGMAGGIPKRVSAPASIPRVKEFGEISKDFINKDNTASLPVPDLDSGPQEPAQTPQASRQENRSSGVEASGGSGSGDTARIGSWAGIVQTRFRQTWQIPEGVPVSQSLRATYVLRISRFGEITNWKLLVSSGNKPYDRSVEAVLGRVKLPPPPGGREEWTFTFVPPYGN